MRSSGYWGLTSVNYIRIFWLFNVRLTRAPLALQIFHHLLWRSTDRREKERNKRWKVFAHVEQLSSECLLFMLLQRTACQPAI